MTMVLLNWPILLAVSEILSHFFFSVSRVILSDPPNWVITRTLLGKGLHCTFDSWGPGDILIVDLVGPKT